MKKIYITGIVIGILMLMTISFVTGAILVRSEFMDKYPNDPLIRTVQACGGMENIDCIKQRARKFTCIDIDETDYNGKKVVARYCFE